MTLESSKFAEKRWLTCLMLLGGLLTVPLAHAQMAHAQKTGAVAGKREQARAKFNQGVSHFSGGHYVEALEAFEQAYKIKPHPSVRLNIASCFEKLNRPAEAAESLQSYLREQRPLSRAKRRELKRRIRTLRNQIGELILRVSPATVDATVRIGGVEHPGALVGKALRLGAGRHEVSIEAAGYAPERREVIITAKGQTLLELTLVPEPVLTPVDPTSSDVEGEGGLHISTPVWISGGITLALLLTGAVTGLVALSADASFEDAVARSRDTTLSQADRDQAVLDGGNAADRAQGMAVATDILLISGLVGAGVTTILFLTQEKESQPGGPENDSGDAGPDGVQVLGAAPFFSRDLAGFAIRGIF